MKLTRFEDLECWQEARKLVNGIYQVIQNDGPFQKDFRLSGQISGAAISVMANIAEGFVRRSDKEFVQFLFIAMSSAAEVQSHLYVALDQEYMDQQTFKSIYTQADKTCRIISGLITYLRSKSTRSTKQTRQTKQTR
jgi:four helix bundle protein